MTFLKGKYGITSLMLSLAIFFITLISVGCSSTSGSGNEPDIRASAEAEPQAVDPDSPVSSDDPTLTPTRLPGSPEGDMTYGLAPVNNIDILIMESFPVQVRVAIRGNLPDGCTQIDQVQVTREDNIFHIELTTRRPVDVECTEALAPYEESVPLDVVGLPAGEYTVEVNGLTETFTLTVDNILE